MTLFPLLSVFTPPVAPSSASKDARSMGPEVLLLDWLEGSRFSASVSASVSSMSIGSSLSAAVTEATAASWSRVNLS